MHKNTMQTPLLHDKEEIPEIPVDFIFHQQLRFGIFPKIVSDPPPKSSISPENVTSSTDPSQSPTR